MKLKADKIIFLLLIVTFLKGVVWASVVPIWHTPDEQAHFAEVSFIAEKKRLPVQISNPGKSEKDLSLEILYSEKLLGTERDEAGINKYTYHPGYNLAYTKNETGFYEKQIKNITLQARKEMVKNEATNYPPLYYFLGAIFYSIFYSGDLILRVYAVRILSIFLTMLTVYFAFLIAKEIFEKNYLLQMSLPILVSFQPMFTFVGIGVSSDNLITLLFTIFIYLAAKVIKSGFTNNLGGLLGMVTGLGMITKPQFFIPLPIILGLFLLEARKKLWSRLVKIFFIFCLVFFFCGGWWALRFIIVNQSPVNVSWLNSNNPYASLNPLEYAKNSLLQTVRQTLPWYWGVFKWLGVTLPREVNRVLMRFTLLVALGFFVWLLKILISRKINKVDLVLVSLFLINLIYCSSILIFDYFFIRANGFSIGIQGRYFLPAIVCQMVMILLGITSLFPKNWEKITRFAIILTCLGMIVLNFVALGTVFSAYYEFSSLGKIIEVVSQYKPWFLKVNWLVFWLTFYLISLILLLRFYVKDSLHQPADKS